MHSLSLLCAVAALLAPQLGAAALSDRDDDGCPKQFRIAEPGRCCVGGHLYEDTPTLKSNMNVKECVSIGSIDEPGNRARLEALAARLAKTPADAPPVPKYTPTSSGNRNRPFGGRWRRPQNDDFDFDFDFDSDFDDLFSNGRRPARPAPPARPVAPAREAPAPQSGVDGEKTAVPTDAAPARQPKKCKS